MRLLGYSVDPDRFIAPTEWSEGTLWLDNEWDSIPAFTEQRRLVTCKIRHYARANRIMCANDKCVRIVTVSQPSRPRVQRLGGGTTSHRGPA